MQLSRESYMSAHVLLNEVKQVGEEINCEACPAFYLFFASLINSIVQEFEC